MFNRLYIDSRHFRPGSRNAYLLAATFVAGGTLARLALGSSLAGTQYITLFPAIFATTLICGTEAGFLATVLATLCAWFFILPPQYSFRLAHDQILGLVFFVAVATLDVVFIGAMRAAIERGRALNRTLTMVFEANPDAILLSDRGGRIVNVNNRASALFGKSRATMVGAAIDSLLPDRLRVNHARYRDAFMVDPHQRGMGIGLALRGLRDDGTEFPVDVQIGPIQIDGDTITIATVRDLTRQNALTEALAESQRRQTVLEERTRAAEELRLWADAFKCAAIGIEISDPRTGIARFVNPAYAAARGMTVEEAQGRTVAEAYAVDERPRLPALLATADRDGRVTFESQELRKDGSSFLSQKDIVSVCDAEGSVVYRVASSRDISDARRTEEALRHTQKMDIMGRLAAGVSHDFNNLLQVILGGTDLLGEDEALSPKSRTFLRMIDNAARRGAHLTHHLLSYSRKQTLTPKLVDLNEVIENLSIVLSRTLPSNIAMITSVALSASQVRSDPGQLETALMNLAINAAHAMPDGGTLRIAARPAKAQPFGEIKPGRYNVIEVTDTGTGMTPEVLACAFDPFFTTKGLEGTGLGLAMVQGFSRQSGGDARITSTLGEGTCCEIWLPEGGKPGTDAALAQARPLRTGHVLLVDDSHDVLVTIEAFLHRSGFTVHHAGSGHEALAILAAGKRFDALVTDYMMAGLNGVALIEEVRVYQPNLPSLIITGYADVTDFLTGLPNATLLRKPFQREDLVAQVSALIAGDADHAIATAVSASPIG